MARSSVSLLPLSENAGVPAGAGRAGNTTDAAVAVGNISGSSEGGGGTTAATSVVDASGVARGCVELDFAGLDFCAVG